MLIPPSAYLLLELFQQHSATDGVETEFEFCPGGARKKKSGCIGGQLDSKPQQEPAETKVFRKSVRSSVHQTGIFALVDPCSPVTQHHTTQHNRTQRVRRSVNSSSSVDAPIASIIFIRPPHSNPLSGHTESRIA